jgi:hypothetical protein
VLYDSDFVRHGDRGADGFGGLSEAEEVRHVDGIEWCLGI